MNVKLVNKAELARTLGVSERTIDRWRTLGVHLGEVRAHPKARPLFSLAVATKAAEAGVFPKVVRK